MPARSGKRLASLARIDLGPSLPLNRRRSTQDVATAEASAGAPGSYHQNNRRIEPLVLRVGQSDRQCRRATCFCEFRLHRCCNRVRARTSSYSVNKGIEISPSASPLNMRRRTSRDAPRPLMKAEASTLVSRTTRGIVILCFLLLPRCASDGDVVVVVPAGAKHDVINTSHTPPHHKDQRISPGR